MKHLIIDGNAQAYRYFFANIRESVSTITATAFTELLSKGQQLMNEYDPDNIVMVFDCKGPSWRGVYTSPKNPERVTHRRYKDGRNNRLSDTQKKKLEEFTENLSDMTRFFREQTGILCLQGNYLEGDDLIAGYVQSFPDDDHIIFSSDKDFLQLINSVPGEVRLIYPADRKDDVWFKERTLEDWDGDPELFLFEKFFRGEGYGRDNIQSAYPRLRRNKILEAYRNDYLLNNLMEHQFVVEEPGEERPITYEYKTREIFNENRILIDLRSQPAHIRKLIDQAIEEGIENLGKFHKIKFIRYCHKYEITELMKSKHRFFEFISRRYRTSGLG